jgi:ferredoxin/flavodoxin
VKFRSPVLGYGYFLEAVMMRRRSFLKKCIGMSFVLAGSCGTKPQENEYFENAVILNKSHKLNNVLVLWYSQTGHTKRNARLIAYIWKKKGLNVTATDLRNFDQTSIQYFDLILLGTPVYYYDTPVYVKDWINALPSINRKPVAAFVTYGRPQGDQHNAACTILELLSKKGGVPVGLRTFMNMETFPISWSNNSITKGILDNRALPNEHTYQEVRSYAESVIEQVSLGYPIPVEKQFTLQRLSSIFEPVWWTKRLINAHNIDLKKCTKCGICVKLCPTDAISIRTGKIHMERCALCFGCVNNCPVQAVVMAYKNRKLFGFFEFLHRKNITIKEPKEFLRS